MTGAPYLYPYRAMSSCARHWGRKWIVALVGPRRRFRVVRLFHGNRAADKYISARRGIT
jgi:hypothetical protein